MTRKTVTVRLNNQQLQLLDQLIAKGEASDRAALILRALRETAAQANGGTSFAGGDTVQASGSSSVAAVADSMTGGTGGGQTARALLHQHVIEPGTGKAIELLAGQILRIEQIEGGQCVDFNCFNLHDYKEFMHTGRTRTLHGLNPSKGAFMWSAPPRERPMIYILEDSAGRNDVMFPRCSAYLYECNYGLAVHTNCHDIQAECQREYGLTPDDVHDSFNLFMNTSVTPDGGMAISRQSSKPGDHVDLLALIDVLAVPNICGADVMRTSNFSLKPVKLTIFKADDADLAGVPPVKMLPSQRTPADFRIKQIKAERELRRDATYRAEFENVPLSLEDIDALLNQADVVALDLVRQPDLYAGDDGAALRDIVFSWWEANFMMKP